jgi:hypothetical protein
MRMPSSRVRCATAYASTPKIPAEASASATTENSAISVSMKRSLRIVSAMKSDARPAARTGWSGAIAHSARFTSGTSASGTGVRTISRRVAKRPSPVRTARFGSRNVPARTTSTPTSRRARSSGRAP